MELLILLLGVGLGYMIPRNSKEEKLEGMEPVKIINPTVKTPSVLIKSPKVIVKPMNVYRPAKDDKLGEILVGLGFMTSEGLYQELDDYLPRDGESICVKKLGEYLVWRKAITQEQLDIALELQNRPPVVSIDPTWDINSR